MDEQISGDVFPGIPQGSTSGKDFFFDCVMKAPAAEANSGSSGVVFFFFFFFPRQVAWRAASRW